MKYLITLIILLVSCGNDKPKADEEIVQNPKTELDQPAPYLRNSIQSTKFTFITNLATHIRETDVQSFHKEGYYGQGLRIAVLDNGFARLEDAVGQSLPPHLKIQPYPQNQPMESEHGTRMAEIIYSLATGATTYNAAQKSPEILLFNTNGFTNFKHAVVEVIKLNVDVVLYSQVWQYGGNFDGKGFINAEVSKATNAGIVWVNAAGNFANASYTTEIKTDGTGNVELPDVGQSLKFTTSYPQLPLKIVASWADYEETEYSQTNIDLDMYVYDKSGSLISKSELLQDTSRKEKGTLTRYPREIILEPFDSGEYFIKLKVKGSRSLPKGMNVRISVEGDGTKINQTQQNQSLMIPADNPSVLTVGASDYLGSSVDTDLGGSGKPDIWSNSLVEFSDGYSVRSSSTAAAIVAGALLPFIQKTHAKSREDVLAALGQSESLKLQVNHSNTLPRRQVEMPHIPSQPTPVSPNESNNSVVNEGDIEYPLPETWQGGTHNDQQHRRPSGGIGNAPQNEPYHRRPGRTVPPQYQRPKHRPPQQPDRQEDIPPFRAVN